jgi:hypothetical protein
MHVDQGNSRCLEFDITAAAAAAANLHVIIAEDERVPAATRQPSKCMCNATTADAVMCTMMTHQQQQPTKTDIAP